MVDTAHPSVGVVVATRERPLLLRQAVRSILDQRYAGRIEVLAVFDQSKIDPSLAFTGPSRSVRVMSNSRRPGLPGARNTGILASDHDLVAFCDDDDRWLPSKIEAQVAMLLDNPAMELVTTGIFVEAQGRVTTRVLNLPTLSYRDLLRSRVTEAHPSTYLTRRSAILDGIGLVDEDIPGGYGEDWDWLLRAAHRADVGVVNLPLTKAFWHASSFFAERWQVMSDACEYLMAKHPDFELEPRGLAKLIGLQAVAAAALGHKREARRLAGRALGLDPRNRRAYIALATSTPFLRTDQAMRALQNFGRGI